MNCRFFIGRRLWQTRRVATENLDTIWRKRPFTRAWSGAGIVFPSLLHNAREATVWSLSDPIPLGENQLKDPKQELSCELQRGEKCLF